MPLKRAGFTHLILLLFIVALAAYLRFFNLAANPGWFSDEGTHLEIAHHILDGRTQYFAINQSTLLFARLPLFEWLLAGSMRLLGGNILALRGLTATLGTGSVFLLYVVTNSLSRDRWLGLTAALMLAIYPQAILYSRLGFSYNLLTPLLLLTLWGLGKMLIGESPDKKRWLAMAAVAVGFGLLTDLAMISIALLLALVVLWHNWRNAWWSGILAAAPLTTFVIFNLLTNRTAFLFDLAYTLTRLGGRSPLDQAYLAVENYTRLITGDSWIAFALVGVWLVRPLPWRNLILLALGIPLLMLGRTVPLVELSYYYISWLLPLIALGAAVIVRSGWSYLLNGFQSRWVGGVVTVVVIGLPLAMSIWLTAGRVQNQFGTVIDRFLLNGADVTAVTNFINGRFREEDMVIASPAVGWRITANTADFQMAVAVNGLETPHFPPDIPSDRWVFQPRFSCAHYVVIDDLWRNWAVVHVAGLTETVRSVEMWPEVFRSGTIVVYKNPAANCANDRPQQGQNSNLEAIASE